jgi:hypothetical protein
VNVHERSKSFAKEGNIFIILKFEFKTTKIFLKPLKNYFLLSRMILNAHSRSFVNVRERLRMIMNDYERSYVGRFTNFHLNVHEPSRRELLNDQNSIIPFFKDILILDY